MFVFQHECGAFRAMSEAKISDFLFLSSFLRIDVLPFQNVHSPLDILQRFFHILNLLPLEPGTQDLLQRIPLTEAIHFLGGEVHLHDFDGLNGALVIVRLSDSHA